VGNATTTDEEPRAGAAAGDARTMLVTGGTGVLGNALVPRLVKAGHWVRVLTRQDRPQLPVGVTAVRGDLLTGDGLAEGLADAEVVVHAATSAFRKVRRTEVEGTERLVEEASTAGRRPHLLYVSIVGVDRNPLPYYKAKWATERVVESSGLPWTIQRATQFHDLLFGACRALTRLPVVTVGRGFSFQPIDAGEVADHLVRLAGGPPVGRAPDLGGPEVLGFDEVVRAYLRAAGKRRPVLRVPLPGRIAAAFRAGHNLCPEHAVGTTTWAEYLVRVLSPSVD